MFEERKKPTTTTKVLKNSIPVVGVNSTAIAKMAIYVEECKDEIGWLGTALHDEKNNTFVIDDVFLFEQDVHGATTEITPEGLGDFANEILQKPDGMELWNNLKVWGHSHVNMGVTPSGQDDKQMETFKEGGHNWFIRIIANKKGDMKIDLYNYATGVIYVDLPWIEVLSQEEQNIKKQINALYETLDELSDGRIQSYEKDIKEEMKEKVREIKYSYHAGYHNQKKNTPTVTKRNSIQPPITTYGNMVMYGDDETDTVDRSGYYHGQDIFTTDDEVLGMFEADELLELAHYTRFDDLQDELEDWGFYNFFTDNDVERIYRVMIKEKKAQHKREGQK